MNSQSTRWKVLGNLVGYQLVWFTAVIGAGRDEAWPAIGAALLFATWQLATASSRMLELRLIAAALLFGTTIDGVAAAGGLIRYSAATPALPPGGAPLWILALWTAFALTLTRSLAWLKGRPQIGMLLGGIGAPLAYLGAARGWHAVVFAPPEWRGVLWLAAAWAGSTTALVRLLTHGLHPQKAARLSCQSSQR
jgi:hypothetical protein